MFRGSVILPGKKKAWCEVHIWCFYGFIIIVLFFPLSGGGRHENEHDEIEQVSPCCLTDTGVAVG